MFWKPPFQILTSGDVISSESREVFYDHTVYFSRFNISDHPLKIWAVEVCSGEAVITVLTDYLQIRLPNSEVLQQRSLVGDAVALGFVSVLPGEAGIKSGLPDGLGLAY